MGNNDLIKRLRADPMYKEALGKARSPAERKAIAELVEGLVGRVGDILTPVIDRVKHDPEFAEQLGKALDEGKDVLTDSTPDTSGSAG
jgi:hypothetical protein